jgi:hypothetical protein
MANKLQMAHERRKLALRSVVLGNRARVAQLQEQTKRARDELKTMSPRKGAAGGSLSAALRSVTIGRKVG